MPVRRLTPGLSSTSSAMTKSGLATESERASRRRFGARLRRIRKRAGLSQDGLGDRAGLHRSEVEKLENAKREPRLTTLFKLSNALRVAPSDLLDGLDFEGGET